MSVRTSAEQGIRDRIAKRGMISFAEFMELALHDPGRGYYATRSAVGAEGDYFTSPVAHPAFGALVAIQLNRMWQLLGCPDRFFAVEMGAGDGTLARDVVSYVAGLPGGFAQALRYISVDGGTPGGLRAGPSNGVERIVASAHSLPLTGVVGCFLSNELVDSFPAHRFQISRGDVKEIYVALDEEARFVDVLGEPSTPELAGYLNGLGLSLPEGTQGEVRLNVSPWLRQISCGLAQGFVITIDYGYEAAELYESERGSGTLQTYYRHTSGDDAYRRVGGQDIAAHVDFSMLVSQGEAHGLRTVALESQARFLRRLGFEEMLRQVRARGLAQIERDENVMAMRELVKADSMGGFRVLVLERDTGIEDASQLAPTDGAQVQKETPLLGHDHIRLLEARYPHLDFTFEELWPSDESLS